MVSLTGDEEEVVDALASCLAIAVSESPDAEYSDLNKTKTQKLLYLAIEEFDLPVTYCWYLAGSLVESDSVDPSAIESAFDTLPKPDSPSISKVSDDPDEEADLAEDDSVENQSPQAPNRLDHIANEFEMSTTDRDRVSISDDEDDAFHDALHSAPAESFDTTTEMPDEQTAPDPSEIDSPKDVEFPARDIVDFLKAKLNSYPLNSTDEFLLHFYHHHAPAGYRELYESSLHIRSELRSITQQVRSVVHADRTLEGIERKVERVSDQITELHFNLYEREELRPTVQGVVSATDVIEDALMMIEQLSAETIDQKHVDALEELQGFFYGGAWKYPALKIAADTATGPSAERITQTRERQFDAFESELKERRDETISTLTTADLVPSYEDYPDPVDDTVGSAITDLFTLYTSQSDSE